MTLAVVKGVVAAGTARVDLAFEPQALVLWWTRQDGGGVARGNSGGVGFWAGGAAVAAAWSSADGVSSTRTARAADEIAVLGLDEDECVLRGGVEGDAQGFDLAWQGGGPWLVHYLALGGLDGAHVGWLDERVETPFAPDLVLVSPVSARAAGAAEPGLAAGFGAATRTGQAAAAFTSRDGVDAADVAGDQRRDAAVLVVASQDDLEALGTLRLGRDGFDLEWERAASEPRLHPYLAIGGVRCAVGTARSPARPGWRRTRGIGFWPEALLLFSWGLSARSGPTDIGRLCIGAATADASGCAGWDDRDVPAPSTATHVSSSTSDVLLVTNTQTGDVHAAAALRSLDRAGFTLDWSRSDGYEREFAYVALASASAPRRLWARSR